MCFFSTLIHQSLSPPLLFHPSPSPLKFSTIPFPKKISPIKYGYTRAISDSTQAIPIEYLPIEIILPTMIKLVEFEFPHFIHVLNFSFFRCARLANVSYL